MTRSNSINGKIDSNNFAGKLYNLYSDR